MAIFTSIFGEDSLENNHYCLWPLFFHLSSLIIKTFFFIETIFELKVPKELLKSWQMFESQAPTTK